MGWKAIVNPLTNSVLIKIFEYTEMSNIFKSLTFLFVDVDHCNFYHEITTNHQRYNRSIPRREELSTLRKYQV